MVSPAGSPWRKFALTELLKFKKVKMYDGSWTEWGNLVGAPVER